MTTITLQPNEDKEVKLVMREGAKATFSWSMDRGVVNYDLHADSVDPPRDYHGYRKGKGATSDEGVLEAAFNGSHGWHWRNKASEPITVQGLHDEEEKVGRGGLDHADPRHELTEA